MDKISAWAIYKQAHKNLVTLLASISTGDEALNAEKHEERKDEFITAQLQYLTSMNEIFGFEDGIVETEQEAYQAFELGFLTGMRQLFSHMKDWEDSEILHHLDSGYLDFSEVSKARAPKTLCIMVGKENAQYLRRLQDANDVLDILYPEEGKHAGT